MLSVPINVSSSGATTVVSAVTGKRIRLLGLFLLCGGTVTVQVQDTGSNNLSGPLPGADGSDITIPIAPNVQGNQLWWAQTTAQGQGLVLNLSAAIAVGGILVYDLAP